MVWHASAFSARLLKLSECRGDINDHLQACHLGQFKGTVQEYELIVNRSRLSHDLYPECSLIRRLCSLQLLFPSLGVASMHLSCPRQLEHRALRCSKHE